MSTPFCVPGIIPVTAYFVNGGVTINNVLINEQIRFPEVRLISETGEQLGLMSARDAQLRAQDVNLDLVLVSPNAKPPVCKIIDYGKYRYELARREKESRKKQKTITIKEIRMTPNIGENDLMTKCNHAKRFLEKGDKVKVVLRFRGREMAHAKDFRHVLEDFAKRLQDVSTIEKQPKMEGRMMSIFLAPIKH